MAVTWTASGQADDIQKRVSIAVLAFEGVRPFQFSLPCEFFGAEHGAGARTELRICGLSDGPLRSAAGIVINADHGLDELARADVVIIPSWHLPHQRPPYRLLNALRTARTNGAILVGLCLGAYVLAEAGLLDGRRATTHWAFADDFRERFPKVELAETQLYVDDDNLLTSAGVAAGIDCCLHLAKRLFGAQFANHVARNMVAAPHRAGGQMQYIDRPMPATNRDSRLRDVLFEIVRTIDEKHSIDSVANRLGMSRRNFTRLFVQTFGVSFFDWLTDMRLALAARALEATSRSVEQIALETGFGSVVTFRSRFSARYGVSPSSWRKAYLRQS